jgi:hypothetical protein
MCGAFREKRCVKEVIEGTKLGRDDKNDKKKEGFYDKSIYMCQKYMWT